MKKIIAMYQIKELNEKAGLQWFLSRNCISGEDKKISYLPDIIDNGVNVFFIQKRKVGNIWRYIVYFLTRNDGYIREALNQNTFFLKKSQAIAAMEILAHFHSFTKWLEPRLTDGINSIQKIKEKHLGGWFELGKSPMFNAKHYEPVIEFADYVLFIEEIRSQTTNPPIFNICKFDKKDTTITHVRGLMYPKISQAKFAMSILDELDWFVEFSDTYTGCFEEDEIVEQPKPENVVVVEVRRGVAIDGHFCKSRSEAVNLIVKISKEQNGEMDETTIREKAKCDNGFTITDVHDCYIFTENK